MKAGGKLPIQTVVKLTTWMGEKLDVIVLSELMTLDNILRSFDFTINQFGWEWDGNEGIFLSSGTGLKDLWHRRLVRYNDRQISEERVKYLEEKGFAEWA
jgi:hypothetical protein